MFISEYFCINQKIIKDYGAIDISLVCDTPLFVDPMLIFNSSKKEYQELNKEIIKYFSFLKLKSKNGLTVGEINTWFNFKEVPNNWLGYSLNGNRGLALGKQYAKFLYDNISFALDTNGISKEVHIEKSMLLFPGSGKDKISDLTVNLIKKYLCDYTEKFAKKYLEPKFCKKICVDKAYFNYTTESFVSEEYYLPFFINEKGKVEYILLSPYDILRRDEPTINRKDFIDNHELIRASIDNETLRSYINNYINIAVNNYENSQKDKKKKISDAVIARIEKDSFKEIVKTYPELFDYYIKLKEKDTDKIRMECLKEVEEILDKIQNSAKKVNEIYDASGHEKNINLSSFEESVKRIRYYKDVIENCDGYKILYNKGKKISNENDLQRLFKFVWYGSIYKVCCETNNGRGMVDSNVSYGSENQVNIEFKLASNSKLNHVFKQLEVYNKANFTEGGIVVIFYFSVSEYDKTINMLKKQNVINDIDKCIFLVDCRNDNKKSASIA